MIAALVCTLSVVAPADDLPDDGVVSSGDTGGDLVTEMSLLALSLLSCAAGILFIATETVPVTSRVTLRLRNSRAGYVLARWF